MSRRRRSTGSAAKPKPAPVFRGDLSALADDDIESIFRFSSEERPLAKAKIGPAGPPTPTPANRPHGGDDAGPSAGGGSDLAAEAVPLPGDPFLPGPATTMAPAASLSHRLWHHRGWSAAGLYEGPCSRYSRSPAHGDNSYCHGFSAQGKLCHSAPDAARWPAVLLQHHGADHARASLVLVMGTTRPTGHCRHLARRLPEMALPASCVKQAIPCQLCRAFLCSLWPVTSSAVRSQALGPGPAPCHAAATSV